MAYLRHEIARLANINIETLRYYEQIGLIPAPERGENGYRLYTEDTLESLKTIRYAKTCGLTLEETKTILSIVNCEQIDYPTIVEFIDQKVVEIDERIEALQHLKTVFGAIKRNIDAQVQCPIKTTLQDM